MYPIGWPNMMRLKPALFTGAVLTVLALVVWQIGQAIHRTFQPPVGVAQRDPATPAYQNGLTLLEIDNVSPDRQYDFSSKGQEDRGGASPSAPAADTGLWVKLPPSVSLPQNCLDSAHSPCQNALTVTARTSEGNEVSLPWRVVSPRSTADPILVSIPAGYPDTVRWADVTLDDKRGNTATWRITHLPPMQHVLAPPVTPQAAFHQGSIAVTARAYRGSDPNGNGYGPMILCGVTGSISHAPNSWELGPLTLTQEWEPTGYVAPSGNITYGTGKDAKNTVTIQATRQAVYYNQTDFYPSATHWVRLSARLQEFGTYDETVTFHNVSVVKYRGSGGRYLAGAQPQTVTSPSGITLTLVDVQHQPQITYSWSGDGVSLLIRYPLGSKFPLLPRSPLWRKHNGPIHVSVEIPKPYESYGSSGDDGEYNYSFRSDKPLPKTFANFPVILRQRVDLRTVPMTFTLPVEDKTPP
jgi:hypothetical protein